MNLNRFDEAIQGKKKVHKPKIVTPDEVTDPIENITWSELIERIDSDDVKLINCSKEDIIEYLGDDKRTYEVSVNKNKKGKSIIHDGISIFGESLVIIYDDDELPEAIAMGSFENTDILSFKHIVIIPQDGGVTCYDKITGNSIQHEIKNENPFI